ncbi:hypothetical protein FSP39_011994 [Pinctada imbricata]|uniref:FAM69 protein-kinase domain-containing protein n=1 Tax=Pinctada imbricata TaxID=66713 RepID=A0AA88XIJ7_PINIB|nr:hypothetical protein FSP39_011994 [Pinctada imbricata]
MTRTIFRDRIQSHLKKTDLPSDLFSYLWSMDYYEFVNSKNNDVTAEVAALQSIWSLANQDEYLLIKLYQDLPYIPKLYGSCGGYYLLEFAPPGNILNQDFIRYSPSPWKERAKIALQLIELSQSVDKDFYEPLHICDVKGENFGVDTQNVIKLIDLDTIFFNKEMLGHLSSGICSKHEDCDFFDCRGWCNITRNRCTRMRTNNNLQSICEDILVDRAHNFYSGLLYYPPSAIKTKLSALLERCAYPKNSKGSTVRQKSETDVYWQLYNLLKYQIQIS